MPPSGEQEHAREVSRCRRNRGEQRALFSEPRAGENPDKRAERGSSPEALGCRALFSPLPGVRVRVWVRVWVRVRVGPRRSIKSVCTAIDGHLNRGPLTVVYVPFRRDGGGSNASNHRRSYFTRNTCRTRATRITQIERLSTNHSNSQLTDFLL